MTKNKTKILHTLSVPVVIFVASLLVGAIIFIMLGKNPLTAYYSILQGCGFLPKPKYGGSQGMLTDFAALVDVWTALLIASLAVAVALKAGIFNIGVSGQMLAAAFIATITVGYGNLPPFLAKPAALFVGAFIGGLVGASIGFLKYKYNINEVVSTIMYNYIIKYIVAFVITLHYINPVSRQSNAINPAAAWTLSGVELFGLKVDIPLGIVVALALAFLLNIMFNKTAFGFEIKAIGLNKTAALKTGMPIGKNIVKAMALSGALAGIAGVMLYMGYHMSIMPRELSAVGFDSIAVALLGGLNPIGIIFSSFIISIIASGSTYMRSVTGVEAEIATVIIGIILLFSACNAYIGQKLLKNREGK